MTTRTPHKSTGSVRFQPCWYSRQAKLSSKSWVLFPRPSWKMRSKKQFSLFFLKHLLTPNGGGGKYEAAFCGCCGSWAHKSHKERGLCLGPVGVPPHCSL